MQRVCRKEPGIWNSSKCLDIFCFPFRVHVLTGLKAWYPITLWAQFTRVPGYFWIRNIFFPDTASVQTHPANSTANADTFKSTPQSEKKSISIDKSDNVWTGESGYFRIRWRNKIVSYRTINQYGDTRCGSVFSIAHARSEDILSQMSPGY